MAANRRCLQALSLTRHYTSSVSPNPSLQSLKTLPHLQKTLTPNPLSPLFLTHKFHHISTNLNPICYSQFFHTRHFSSDQRDDTDNDENDDEDDDEDEDEDEDEDAEEDEEDIDDEIVSASKGRVNKSYTPEEREQEAAEIGYKVIGPIDRSTRPFKPYVPVFAVVQIGSHQFKTQTIIGRPILPDAEVHAVVEEHALDAKVIIFKKKRRKNYRRTRGHRQELTKLRIVDIQGIEKPEMTKSVKTEKAAVKKPAKVPVAA